MHSLNPNPNERIGKIRVDIDKHEKEVLRLKKLIVECKTSKDALEATINDLEAPDKTE